MNNKNRIENIRLKVCLYLGKLRFLIAFLTITGSFLSAAFSPSEAKTMLDLSFGNGGKVLTSIGNRDDFATAVAIQSDGKIVSAGRVNNGSNNVFEYDFAVIRYNTDGTLDNSFGTGGKVITALGSSYDIANALAIQPDGKIVVVGETTYGFAAVRYNTDGSLDTSFGEGGKVVILIGTRFSNAKSLALQSDGKIVAAGYSDNGNSNARDFALVRLNTNGTLDNSFGTGGKVVTPVGVSDDSANAVAIQSDGKIIAAGNSLNGSDFDFVLVRYNTDGSLDNSFGLGGKVVTQIGNSYDYANTVVIQSDGKIVAVGSSYTNTNPINSYFALARYNTNGLLDNSFGTNGKVITAIGGVNSYANAAAIQPDGKIVAAGYTIDNTFTLYSFAVARYNTNGILDRTFGMVGKITTTVDSRNSRANAVAIQPNGQIVTAGVGNVPYPGAGSRAAFALARYDTNSVTSRNSPFDYDGDGKADISVFRPSSNIWYVQNSMDNSFNIQQAGAAGDLIAPAEFDLDGKTDIAVFRPSNGTWYIQRPYVGTIAVKFGLSGDVPVPADYDGDGIADLAVFRPSNGVWYILKSSDGQVQITQFGIAEDKPTIGDFDGDGKADIALFRPSTGVWYRLNSSDNSFFAAQFGISEDKPVAADYDGDGKTDLAVFRPSSGVWYRINSGYSSYSIAQFGTSEDKPVAADYDGDGKADIAVFRPSQNTWYLQKSQSGFTAQQFGVNGDLPTPNAFVP